MGAWDATNLSSLLKLTQTLNRSGQGRPSALPEVQQKSSDVPEVTLTRGWQRATSRQSVNSEWGLAAVTRGLVFSAGRKNRLGRAPSSRPASPSVLQAMQFLGEKSMGERRGCWRLPVCSYSWEGWRGGGRRKNNSQSSSVRWLWLLAWAAGWGREFSTHWAGTLFKLQLNNRSFHHFTS